ncbi:anion transporter [Thermostichus vulcanus]|uniref:Anion transporter n=1 Tax=Thermostichus vulcanus str. 'Rupite' TaxID=2813851 RepID=A0ABT0CD45_THEVL|nr:anion transporter [Thermostichus vulcanus str. 'Rupite']
MQELSWLVLGLSYVGLGLGSLPRLRMNRATIALVGSALLIGLGTLSLRQAWEAIDPTTIVFLLSMMVVNASLSYGGAFQVALVGLIRASRSPFGLLIMLVFGSGLLSAFLLNDTLALVFTPLTLQVTTVLGLNSIPYLLALAAATNLGSVATLSGNPQNILVGSFSGIGYLEFAGRMTPIAVVGLLVEVGLLWLYYPQVRSLKPFAEVPWIPLRLYPPLLRKSVVITGGLFVAFVAGIPLAESALVAAALLLITRRLKPERFLGQVDWNLLVMFSGLFILTRATRELVAGSPWGASLWPLAEGLAGSPLSLLGGVALLSNTISNVPAVLLLQPLIPQQDATAWLLLAAGSTLAGNLTLFGAVANLITVEAAAKKGYTLTFGEHLRFGLPLTMLTLGFTWLWLR